MPVRLATGLAHVRPGSALGGEGVLGRLVDQPPRVQGYAGAWRVG
jgi:hypothetical protein